MLQTLITSKDPKGLHFVGLCEAVYNKARLDPDQAQRLNEKGDELQAGLKSLIEQLTTPNQYANEEVESNYGYLSGYEQPIPIVKQVAVLRELFPELKDATYNETIEGRPLPNGAEGYFAIPRSEKIASAYGEAVEMIIALLHKQRKGKVRNYREKQLGERYLRLSTKTAQALQTIGGEQQEHDILIIPAQLGLRHAGRSVRRALEVMNTTEFGLDPFSAGIMLLTHPNRLNHYDDLWIDLSGCKYAPDADGAFSGALSFVFRGGELEFGRGYVGAPHGNYGSASAFLGSV